MKWFFIFEVLLIAFLAAIYFGVIKDNEIIEQPDSATSESELTSYNFSCPSGESFSITYSNQTEAATLVLEGDMAYQLERAVSGSGARYTSAAGDIVFWEHQGEARVEINDVVRYEACVAESDSDTDIPSDSEEIIYISNPNPGATITSPITLRGQARGYWFFEATAPIEVVDWDGRIIGEGYISAAGDWMTEDFVSFTGEVFFTVPADTAYKRGTIIFQKANPSGLPENDIAVEIPVQFSITETSTTTSQADIVCDDKSKAAAVCTTEYAPVCGLVAVQCVTTPCPPIPETFSNGCTACAQGNVISYVPGACEA